MPGLEAAGVESNSLCRGLASVEDGFSVLPSSQSWGQGRAVGAYVGVTLPWHGGVGQVGVGQGGRASRGEPERASAPKPEALSQSRAPDGAGKPWGAPMSQGRFSSDVSTKTSASRATVNSPGQVPVSPVLCEVPERPGPAPATYTVHSSDISPQFP